MGASQSSMIAPDYHPEPVHCIVMRINLDCNACCRKMRRILLSMKEIERHEIEKQQRKVRVWGRFVPADLAIKIKKKMNRRVVILEIQELDHIDDGHVEQQQMPYVAEPQPFYSYLENEYSNILFRYSDGIV